MTRIARTSPSAVPLSVPRHAVLLTALARGDVHVWEVEVDTSGTGRADHAAACGAVQVINSCGRVSGTSQAVRRDATRLSTGGTHERTTPPECSGRGECHAWELEVTEPGEVLRVSWDAASTRASRARRRTSTTTWAAPAGGSPTSS